MENNLLLNQNNNFDVKHLHFVEYSVIILQITHTQTHTYIHTLYFQTQIKQNQNTFIHTNSNTKLALNLTIST